MIRSYTGKSYQVNTLQARVYQIHIPTDSAECTFIQEKKDELLISLTKYFSKEIEKSVVETQLSTIRRELIANCPSYSARPGCC